ncbi:hypothetical protein FHX64_000041 [Microbacter margulisiae]|uniref:UPF0246 protein FHX64_000041 n=2 Tax=Microbacter margulisiae TaxID=1350067 RepID=A0A7W5DPF0_9PORP|nr:hypothetical protein [Microbacter margulisiae]
MNFKPIDTIVRVTQPQFSNEAYSIMQQLISFSASDISKLEHLSFKLAYAAFEFNQQFFNANQIVKPAIFTYSGTVFDKLNPYLFTTAQLLFVEKHLRIFSALYGLLRPFDLIHPYRLDMHNGLIDDLYSFWSDKVTTSAMEALMDDDCILINLASAEYFEMLTTSYFSQNCQILTPIFKQEKRGKLLVNSFKSKEARGLMTRFIIENQISDPEYLKGFMEQGYAFSQDLSANDEWIFIR